ncbi:hypothetical protein ACQ5SO_14080 [Rhodovulum sp. DZ06]|uniref:hypothetical protein n=1 Tax=Rhodovulum sp. DZ06 TaxID=3425126 RepID=UPI003D357DF3
MTHSPRPSEAAPRRAAAALLLGAALSALAAALPAAPARAQQAPAAAAAPGDAVPAPPSAEAPPPADRSAPAFLRELPPFAQARLRARLDAVSANIRRGDQAGGAAELIGLANSYPHLLDLRLSAAALLLRFGAVEQALDSVEAAVDGGFSNAGALESSPELAALASHPRFRAAIAAARENPPLGSLPPHQATPAPIEDGAAPISLSNTAWSERAGALVSLFEPRARPEDPGEVTGLEGPGAELLTRLVQSGQAAGPWGDFYENRDAGHSILPIATLHDLARIAWPKRLARTQLARGVKGAHLFGGPTFGNASVAITGRDNPLWRSMGRLALTSPGGPEQLFRQYRRNQLYVYPEHKDHDPFFGDVATAMTPYFLLSQGSSGSDRPLLVGLAMALSALRPEVKAALTEKGLIAPTLQMLIRRSMKGIESDADYLSPAAHKVAFPAEELDFEALVARANALTLGDIPGPTTLRVISEMRPDKRIEEFGDAYDERWFTTPHAISRIARGAYRTRVFHLTAGAPDPNGRKLKIHWTVLSGGARGVRIEELKPDGSEVKVHVPWQRGMTAPGRPDLRTFRLDVMAVADNGAQLSAPAFLSVLFPARRVVEFDGERPLSVVYDARTRLDEYQDPMVFPVRRWRDDYAWTEGGEMLGWTRTHADGRVERFTRHGALVEEADAQGRPLRARAMSYPTGRPDDGARLIAPTPLDAVLVYGYDGPEDRLGEARLER